MVPSLALQACQMRLPSSNVWRPAMSTASPTDLADLEQRAVAELAACGDEAALRGWNNKYFGKQGELALALRRIGEVPPADRKAYGQEANRLKEALTHKYEEALAAEQERGLAKS